MGQARGCLRWLQQRALLFARFFRCLDERIDAIRRQPVATREKTDRLSLRDPWSRGHLTKFNDYIVVSGQRFHTFRHVNDDCKLANMRRKLLQYK